MPADLLGGENVIAVHLAAILIDFLAVDTGGTAAAFEMVAYAGKIGEFVGAPGTFDGFAHVRRRFQMLYAS